MIIRGFLMKIGNININKLFKYIILLITSIILFIYYNIVISYNEYDSIRCWNNIKSWYLIYVDIISSKSKNIPKSDNEWLHLVFDDEEIPKLIPKDIPKIIKFVNRDSEVDYKFYPRSGDRINLLIRVYIIIDSKGKIVPEKCPKYYYKKLYFFGFIPYIQKEDLILSSLVDYYYQYNPKY